MAFRREAVIKTAEKYVARGKIEAAIREYRKVLKHSPTDVNTLNRVGDLYARLESYDEAVRLFTQIAEQYTREGFFVKAIAIYKKIIKLDPSSLQVYEKLAALYAEQGLVTEARTQYQVLANYYQKHDNAASAITIYQRMAELEPDNPTFQLKLAELFVSRRLIDRALASYERLADIFLVSGSIDEAVRVYLTALDVSAEDLEFIERAIRNLEAASNGVAAGRVLAKATELNAEAAGISLQSEEPAGEPGPAVSPGPAGGQGGLGESPEMWTTAALDEVQLERTSVPKPAAVAEPFRLDLGPDELADSAAHTFSDTGAVKADRATDPAASAGQAATDPLQASGGLHLELEPASDDSDSFVFELDLDDDEIPESLVQPPADMVDSPTEDWTEATARTAARTVEDEDEALAIALAEGTVPAADEAAARGEQRDGTFPTLDSAEIAALEDFDLTSLSFDVSSGADEIEAEVESKSDATPITAAEEDGVDIDWSLDPLEDAFEIDIDASQAAASAAPSLDDSPPDTGTPDTDTPPDTGTEAARDVDESPSRAMRVRLAEVRQEEDLLAEAQVFAKYGLREKAEERLRELWNLNPHNLEALQLKTGLLLEDGDPGAVIAEANSLAALAERAGNLEPWQALCAQLVDVGYRVEKNRIVGPPGEKIKGDRISNFLEALDNTGSMPLTDVAPDATTPPAATVSSDEGLVVEIDDALDSFFEASSPKPAAARGQSSMPSDRLGSGDRAGGGHAAPSAVPPKGQEPFDESGLSWLDETQTSGGSPAGSEVGKKSPLFDEEDGFFDLAAEIERELDAEESGASAPLASPSEPSLEEIVEGFKRGVAEHLSAEDYDTHFNLGIAYREMGLLDEAIGEFQLSSKDSRYLVESSSMLGMSFLEKGLPDLALKWYRKGLEAPDLGENSMLGLLYDMAGVLEQMGSVQAAHTTWVEIYGVSSTYRDVSERLASSSQAVSAQETSAPGSDA